MQKKQSEKLEDFLSGIKALDMPDFFPIGAVVCEEKDRSGVLEKVKTYDFNVLAVGSEHPDVILKQLYEVLGAGEIMTLDVRNEIHSKLLDQLTNISNNFLNVNLSGLEEPVILNPLPRGGKVILIVNQDQYDALALRDVISSVCRI